MSGLSLLLALSSPPTSAPSAVEDLHQQPPSFDDVVVDPLPPLPAHLQYPLAAQFVSAHPSNYVAGGMQNYEYVIIHTQEGVYEGTISWFQYSGSNVSTHYVMRSHDGEITQMVHHEDMAQHIGGYNPMSFGIEHEGYIYEPGWYTWETYVSSAQLTRWLCDHYDIPIDREHIVGHVEVPGASHTDPGPYWEWDMYMALVNDVIPQGRVEGVVVDRSRACTLTATADTWITTTLETLDALDDDEQCFVPAGTEIQYLHASEEMISQRRLTMDGGGPCGGMGTLDGEAFAWMPSFTEPCDPLEMAASEGVEVLLDGMPTTVDDEGRFAFEGIAPGPHMIDVTTDGTYVETSVPIDVEVYPGVRVVIALDPGEPPMGTTTGASDSGTSSSQESNGDAGGDTDASGDAPTTGAAETTATGLPGGSPRGGDDGGCGCRTRTPQGGGAWVLPLLGLFSIRRSMKRR